MEGGQLVAVEQLLGARMVGVLGAGAPPALPDLVARRLQHRLVGGVLPQHQILDDAEQPLALLSASISSSVGSGPGSGTTARALGLLGEARASSHSFSPP